MLAALVIDQDVAARRRLAGEHLPAVDGMAGAREGRRRRVAAGGDDHDIRILFQHGLDRRRRLQPELHARLAQLVFQPAHDARERLPPWHQLGQLELAAQRIAGLEQHDPMPARRRHPRGLEPGRPAAGDDHALRRWRFRQDMRHGRFAPGRRVLDAGHVHSGRRAIDAIGGAHALADGVRPILHQLPHDVGVGDVAARHRDHVDMASATARLAVAMSRMPEA
jgi:hypothetical protein